MQVRIEECEKRNLGVEALDIVIEEEDQAAEVENFLSGADTQYMVLKIPTSRTDITFMTSQYGFSYMEDLIFFSHDLHENHRTSLQQRLYDAVTISPMEKADMDDLLDRIRKGMFSFDRISNDPYFTQEQANRRFENWIGDEISRGAEFLKGTMNGKTTGFFCLRDMGDGIYTSALGGTYPEYRRGGLGTNVQTQDEVRKRGGKKVILGVSTNNMIQIRALIANEYFPEHAHHVFVKHCDL
jgi:hypothetical protein